jgi:hypothetical protein
MLTEKNYNIHGIIKNNYKIKGSLRRSPKSLAIIRYYRLLDSDQAFNIVMYQILSQMLILIKTVLN